MKEIAGYVGAAIALILGIVFLWWPPAVMAGQAGTVGTALTFISAGLGAVGVSVALPAAQRSGYREGYADAKAGHGPKHK